MDQALPAIKRAAEAFQRAHDSPASPALDLEAQESIIALMDCLQQLSVQEDMNYARSSRSHKAILLISKK